MSSCLKLKRWHELILQFRKTKAAFRDALLKAARFIVSIPNQKCRNIAALELLIVSH
jgi:hypothetical protein